MPKTIIKIKTWSCECGYQQDFEPTLELMTQNKLPYGFCPRCKKTGILQQELVTDKCITLVISGEEDIDSEIVLIKECKGRGGKVDLLPDLDTPEKENTYKVKRLQDIQEAISNSRALEYN